jgi:hypothetical protein
MNIGVCAAGKFHDSRIAAHSVSMLFEGENEIVMSSLGVISIALHGPPGVKKAHSRDGRRVIQLMEAISPHGGVGSADWKLI